MIEIRQRLDGARTARLLFCAHDGFLIGLHVFIKKSQKTPKADLDLAIQRMKAME